MCLENTSTPLYPPTHATPQRKIYYGLHMCAQDEKVIELCRNVKLRPELARKCLEQAEVGWDLNKAFMDVKAKMAAVRPTPPPHPHTPTHHRVF